MPETLGQLAADLRKAAAGATAVADVALRKASQNIVADAQAGSPVDTGFNRASISATIDGLTSEIGPTSEYGGYLELGTSKMPPRPYLRPAFDRNVEPFLTAIEQAATGLL